MSRIFVKGKPYQRGEALNKGAFPLSVSDPSFQVQSISGTLPLGKCRDVVNEKKPPKLPPQKKAPLRLNLRGVRSTYFSLQSGKFY